MTIPNFISIARLIMVPMIVWAILEGEMMSALIIFMVAGISDGVDGFIARQYNQKSELGAYLDPIADKALLVTSFLALGYLGHFPLWLVILVVSRDALIVMGVVISFLLEQPVEMKPLFVSKANTTVQILVVAVVLLSLAFSLDFSNIKQLMVWSVAIFTIASAIAYLSGWVTHLSAAESE